MRLDQFPPITTDQLPFLSLGRYVIAQNTLLKSLGGGDFSPLRPAHLVDYRRYPRVVPSRWGDRNVIPASATFLSDRRLSRN